MTARDDGWFFLSARLSPGQHGYMIEEAGERRLDELQPLSTFEGDVEVSLAQVSDCALPLARVTDVTATDDGAVHAEGAFVRAAGGRPLASVSASTSSGAVFRVTTLDPASGLFRLDATGLAPGKHTLTVRALDAAGLAAEPASAAVWVAPRLRAWDDAVLYQIVLDRFRGPGGSALAPPSSPGAFAGGTLDGVRAELERGTFEAMGVNALWISPVYQNPEGQKPGRDGHAYEGYHGYWPLEPRKVAPRLGGEAALSALVDAAHARGMRVLFDLVPNHVYVDSPRYLDGSPRGWFNDKGACVCGDPGCGWGDHIQTCWFAPYLPDVRFQSEDATRAVVDDALFWMRRFDADGVRIDAVPMMPRAATRRIAAALRADQAPARSRFVLGEVFTGPGEGGIDQVRYHLGPAGLDSAFDFPLLWVLRDAVATGKGSFVDVEATLAAEEVAYRGSGTVPARILGNHDTERFLSVAAGDAGRDPWASPPPQPTAAGPAHARLALAHAIVMTLPGMPVLYYGDEIGLAGVGDPDCRRVMPKDAPPGGESVRRSVSLLGRLRACSVALRRGGRRPLSVTDDAYAFVREAPSEAPVVVVASRRTSSSSVALTGAPAGSFVDVLSGETFVLPGAVAVPPIAARVLVPTSSPCAALASDGLLPSSP